MIDARTHAAALAEHREGLAAAQVDPALRPALDELLAEVADHPADAALGSLLDHLLQHAQSDGLELDLLAEAAAMWTEGVSLYTEIGAVRADVEAALADPAQPDAAARYCGATVRLRKLGERVHGKHLEIQDLGRRLAEMRHVPEHPRQGNLPLDAWGWGDVFLARRTDAFVRAAFATADTPATRATAFGVLSGHAANAAGSAYLGKVVGGPRRSHRFRDRIARNTVGAYLAQLRPDAGDFRRLAATLRYDAAPEARLPDEAAAFLTEVLGRTYDLGATAPPPDLRLGYGRLVRQLELLGTFRQPPRPKLPAPVFVQRLWADPAHPPDAVVTTETATPPAVADSGLGPATYSGPAVPPYQRPPSATDSTRDSDNQCGSFWIGVLGFLAFVGTLGGVCWEQWGNGTSCTFWDKHVSDNFRHAFETSLSPEEQAALASQYQQLTPEEFARGADVPQLTQLVGLLFDFQARLWEGLRKAGGYLAGCGLTAPDGRLRYPLYRQFLAVPSSGDNITPRRPEADPVAVFYRYPLTPLEEPSDGGGGLPVGTDPGWLLRESTAAVTALWTGIAEGASGEANPDLDADRFRRYDCWAPGGSIDDDPVDVRVLDYGET
ncbi:hypothetical protein HUT16_13105 [Kitasatospora sp. NA04385]|uniref:hypothetical protein n=1 Tax=Kitasatospora sp. NA04385 TaxID=2742135 RepID=UPI00158FB5A9|nr:hypothetical protein [Kitasatospora sp. NA04385]QKW19872.1 hypothetical protein HUT16_13105 [Kitasatospora sp. NA04385]